MRRSSSGSLGSKRALELLAPSPTCLPMRACALHDYIMPGPGTSDLRASRHLRPGHLCTSDRKPASCVRPRHTLRAPFSPFSRRHRRVLTPHHVSRPARRAIVSLPCHHYGPAGTPWRACRVPRVACSFPHLSIGKYHDSLSLLAWPQTLHVSDGWSRSVWSRSLVVGRPSNVRHAWRHTTNEAMCSNASRRLSPHGALGSFSNRALPHHRSQVSEFRPVSVLSYPRNGFLRFARLTDEAALSGASAGSAVPMVSVGPWAGRGLLFVLLGVSLWQILARGFSSGETPPPPLPANTFACLHNCRDRRLT